MKLNDAIASACEQLGISYQENALWFEILSLQVFRTFKSYKVLAIKKTDLEIADGKAKLPLGFIELESLIKKGAETASDLYCEGNDFSIQDNYICFSSELGLEDGDKVTIRYKSLNTNEDGEPILPDNWERMLVGYFCWKYTLKHFDKFNQFVIEQYRREYVNQKQALL